MNHKLCIVCARQPLILLGKKLQTHLIGSIKLLSPLLQPFLIFLRCSSVITWESVFKVYNLFYSCEQGNKFRQLMFHCLFRKLKKMIHTIMLHLVNFFSIIFRHVNLKICLLTYKALDSGDPKYFSDFLKPNTEFKQEHAVWTKNLSTEMCKKVFWIYCAKDIQCATWGNTELC